MSIPISILKLVEYVFYYINAHTILNKTGKVEKTSFLSIPFIVLYCVFPITVHLASIVPFIYIFSVVLSHKKEILKSIYVSILYMLLAGIIGALFLVVLTPMTGVSYTILNPCVDILFHITFFFIFKLYTSKNEENLRLSLNLLPWKIYISILLYLGTMSAYLSSYMVALQRREFDRFFIEFSGIFVELSSIISLIIIVLFITSNLTAFYYKRASSLLDEQLELQANYYEKLDQLTNDVRMFRHDYKNHMACIKTLLTQNKTSEAIEYLNSIADNLTMQANPFQSGNTIADALLNDKLQKAASIGCKLNFSGHISSNITAFDLCTILANALDNAIEACESLPEGHVKEINVNCMLEKNTQVISISNPMLEINPGLKTTKHDTTDHGYGLYNIQKTVEALGGNLNISQKPPLFTLDIMFPIS